MTMIDGGISFMIKTMEYTKKIAVIRKLLHMDMLSENEYKAVRDKLMSEYMVFDMETTYKPDIS